MQGELTAANQPTPKDEGLNPFSEARARRGEEGSMEAYVLIQTEPNRGPIAESLRGITGVISAENLRGPFDAIALARSDSTRSLTEQVVAEIKRLPGVLRALSAPLISSLGQSREADAGGRVVAA